MIGVVGDDELCGGLRDRIEAVGGDAIVGTPATVLEAAPTAVIAGGTTALIDLVSAGLDAPVLLMEATDGLPSGASLEANGLVAQLVADQYRTQRQPLLGVRAGDGEVGRAVFDVMLVRAEPGRISEYSVSGDGTDWQFRADGVVVATPAGSHGYANAAGGPRLAPGLAAVAVVPVAAFGLGAPDWVLDPNRGLELGVERDEGDVSLLLDGRDRDRLTGRATVTVEPRGSLRIIIPQEP